MIRRAGDTWACLSVEASERGVTAVRFGGATPPGGRSEAHPTVPLATGPTPAARMHAVRALDQIREYLSGSRQTFDVSLDLSRLTPFRRSVLAALLAVPFGETVTYGQIATRVACGSARAVGQAVGSNPVPIVVPCHRVLASGGRLGGFSSGLERKVALLGIEGLVAADAAFQSPVARTGALREVPRP